MEERADSLDEAFLSSCFTYTKKASDDGLADVVNALQKIMQLHAARQLRQAEQYTTEDTLLQDVLTADESEWDEMIEEMVKAGAVHRVAHSCCRCILQRAAALRCVCSCARSRTRASGGFVSLLAWTLTSFTR